MRFYVTFPLVSGSNGTHGSQELVLKETNPYFWKVSCVAKVSS